MISGLFEAAYARRESRLEGRLRQFVYRILNWGEECGRRGADTSEVDVEEGTGFCRDRLK